MNASRVFVPQIPSKHDAPTGLWVPTVNMSSAEKYGELVVMLPPNVNRMHAAPLVAAMRERLADFTEDDWLVALGDPTLIAAAAAIVSRKIRKLKMLKWDRMISDYLAAELPL